MERFPPAILYEVDILKTLLEKLGKFAGVDDDAVLQQMMNTFMDSLEPHLLPFERLRAVNNVTQAVAKLVRNRTLQTRSSFPLAAQ